MLGLDGRPETDTQIDALQEYGCDRIFQEKISGLSVQRPAWIKCSRSCALVIRWLSRVSRAWAQPRPPDQPDRSFCQRGIIFKALDLGIDSATLREAGHRHLRRLASTTGR
ncbi:hypothetical protein [Salmonirosea aquatica]|uniref:hypothetical protein n=1 Tax=Salmonirosea aquatica TaxID=2654236 RepID=UPI003570D468